MSHVLLKIIIVIAGIYCVGDIIIGFSNDMFWMRAVSETMSFIFSTSLLIFIVTRIDRKIRSDK